MWQIKESFFDKEKIAHYGNQFLIGHLKLGVRGTLDEFRKSEMVAINLPMVYDQVGEGWRESINAMNVLYTYVKVNGKNINVNFSNIFEHEQTLDMSCGLMKRRTVFLEDGIYITIESERFVNQEGSREIYGLYKVSLSDDAHLEIESGIDYDVWDLHGPHLHTFTFSRKPHLYVKSITHEKGHIITASKTNKPLFTCQKEEIHEQKILGERFIIDAKKDVVYTIETYSFIGVNSSEIDDQYNINHMINLGYPKALNHQKDYWSKLWNISDVKIEGNIEAQRALRYSIYHLLILAPKVNYRESIPARGISGQTYKGAIFWDTEIFMLPFYLNTDIMSAKSIIEYRIKGLEGAKQKAKSYGYQGAFYAWESHEDGIDACTDYNVTDVFTGRPVRTYFRDKQIHISGDIVYAIESYISKTQDFEILREGALEVILEVARFYIDYGHYAPLKDRFEIHDVLGPDEYHERVHNNAFTNQLIKMVFDAVIKYENYFQHEKSSYFDELVNRLDYKKTLTLIKTYNPKLFLQEPTINGLIEQFDGYFNLKDITKDILLKDRIHPNEYLGGYGLAGDTKIIKQADVITMLYLFNNYYDQTIMKSNFDYYEPKTEHGSSLSASMYALVACMIDNPDYAYPLFMKSASVDLTGDSKHYAGGIYIGGTHPAASGGAYMTAIFGFAGLKMNEKIYVEPHLPKSIESITFKVTNKNKLYEVFVSHKTTQIKEINL